MVIGPILVIVLTNVNPCVVSLAGKQTISAMQVYRFLVLLIVPIAFIGAMDSSEESDEEFDPLAFLGGNKVDLSKLNAMKEKMMKQTKTCLDVEIPKVVTNAMYKCCMMAVKESGIMSSIAEGNFPPDKNTILQYLEIMRQCKVETSTAPYNDTYLDLDKYVELANVGSWEGDPEDVKIMEDIMNRCTDQPIAAPQEMVLTFERCSIFEVFKYCDSVNEGDEMGMMTVLWAALQTMGEECKCSDVKIPDEFKQQMYDCIDEAKEKIVAKKDPRMNKRLDIKVMMSTFFNDFMAENFKCFFNKGEYPKTTKTSEIIDRSIELTGQFEGWDAIPEIREKIINAMRSCAMSFEDESDTYDDMIKMILSKMKDYDRCFIPKLSETCGMECDLFKVLYPLTEQEYVDKMKEAFMELGGDTANTLVDMAQKKMKSFADMMQGR